MKFGIVTDSNDKTYCKNCGTHVGDNRKTQMNFCPKCGTHLRLQAAAIYDKRVNSEIISVLYQVIDSLEENDEDPKETLEAFIKELSENK